MYVFVIIFYAIVHSITYAQHFCDKVCLWHVADRWFSAGIPPTIKNWPPRYNWNNFESGVKHHNTNPYCLCDIDKNF
jgi:hypothetical protein